MSIFGNACTRSDCAHNRKIIEMLLREKNLEQPTITLNGDAAEVFRLNELREADKRRIEELEKALKFYAGETEEAEWFGSQLMTFDKFGGLDDSILGPHVAQEALNPKEKER